MTEDTIIVRPSYFTLHEACENWIVPHVKRLKYQPQYIIGLSRGGLFPAIIISHMLDDMEMIPVRYSSKSGKGDDKNHSNALPLIQGCHPPATLLIVDDICDSGLTLSEVVEFYKFRGHHVYTATLYYKDIPGGPIEPDIYWHKIPEDAPWIVFPFEAS